MGYSLEKCLEIIQESGYFDTLIEKETHYIYCVYKYVFNNPNNPRKLLIQDNRGTDHPKFVYDIFTNPKNPFSKIIQNYYELQKV